MKNDIIIIHECCLSCHVLFSCDSRLFIDFFTYPVVKDHLGFTVANKFIRVLWVEGDIRLAWKRKKLKASYNASIIFQETPFEWHAVVQLLRYCEFVLFMSKRKYFIIFYIPVSSKVWLQVRIGVFNSFLPDSKNRKMQTMRVSLPRQVFLSEPSV